MDLERLFYPRSVAVVGASQKPIVGKLPYYQILKALGYEGRIYPVNPKYKEIDGVKVYPSLDAVPGEIDFAIISIPVQQSLDVMQAVARKNVKYVHFFTSGFGEEGDVALEQNILREARKGGTRIVGPNCIGIHSPESGISFGFLKQEGLPRDVAFLGQSGGMTSNFARLSLARQIGLNKLVSCGNQIDLRMEDYLAYFATDDSIKLVAGYIEDIKDPGMFLDTLKKVTKTKPVVIMKGGMTQQGAHAATSHTGALASNHAIWSSAMRQCGAILVNTFDQLIDTAMAGVGGTPLKGPNIAFLGAGGGVSVSFTDCAILAGLTVPTLHRDTQETIRQQIGSVNTSTENPVDLGAFGFDFSVMAHTIEAIDRDDGIDVIMPYFSVDYITRLNPSQIKDGPYAIVKVVGRTKKPIMAVVSRFSEDDVETERLRITIHSIFREAGIPVFSTISRAIDAVARYLTWAVTY